jgi:hypothetical protein
MPERTFRVVIRNASTFTLNQSFNHLCWGDWTPGGWVPPPTIAPGQSGGLQSEGGFLSGTEGYVKYDVNAPNGRRGMIYVYWDNPWYGVTRFRFAGAPDDVLPDCDFDPPAGGSTFPPATNLDFGLDLVGYMRGTEGGGNITSVAFLTHYIVGPVSLLGLVGIDKNPTLSLVLRDADELVPSFGTSTGAITLELMSDATPAEWTGRWEGGLVRCNIVARHPSPDSLVLQQPPLTATLRDASVAPPLFIEEAFTPGPGGLLSAGESLVHAIAQGLGQDDLQRSALADAAASVLATPAALALSPRLVAQRVETIARDMHCGGTPTSIAAASARSVGRAIAKLVAPRGGVAYLGHRIVLRLFAVMQGGARIGKRLQVQRMDALGRTLSTALLDHVPDIR